MIRALLSTALLGCTKHDLVTIDLSDRLDVVAFVVVLDEGGLPLRVTRPFGVTNGEVSFGERAQLELVEGEASAVLVEIEHAELAIARPDYVRSRAEEIGVEVRPPPEPPLLDDRDAEEPLESGPLPANAAIGEVSPEVADTIRSSLTLTLPVDPEYCRPTRERFVAFGAALEAYPIQNDGARDFRDFVRVGDLVVIRGFDRMLVLERGGMIDPPAVLKLGEVFPGDAMSTFDSIAVDPTPRMDGSTGIAATIDRDLPNGGSESVLAEIALDGTALRYVGTATATLEIDYSVVDVSSDGTAAFVAEEGFLFVEEGAGFAKITVPVDMNDNPKLRQIIWTEDPSRPLMFTSRNNVHFYNPATGRFISEVLSTVTEQSLHFQSLRSFRGRDGGEEIWGAGTFGYILRYRRQTLERIEAKLPPRYAVCAGAQADTSAFTDPVADVAVLDGYAYAVVARCSAVLAVRIEDGCSSLIPAVGDAVSILDPDAEALQAIDASNGELILVGRRGRVWSLVP
jgi:hypothetical protein